MIRPTNFTPVLHFSSFFDFFRTFFVIPQYRSCINSRCTVIMLAHLELGEAESKLIMFQFVHLIESVVVI